MAMFGLMMLKLMSKPNLINDIDSDEEVVSIIRKFHSNSTS